MVAFDEMVAFAAAEMKKKAAARLKQINNPEVLNRMRDAALKQARKERLQLTQSRSKSGYLNVYKSERGQHKSKRGQFVYYQAHARSWSP